MKIWLRFSTFSFFTALICEATNYARADARSTTYKRENTRCMWGRAGRKIAGKRSYVFECCRDGFRFVLVLQVLVRHLKDILLFFPFLFILPHVSWGENTDQHGQAQGRALFTFIYHSLCFFLHWFQSQNCSKVSTLITQAHCSKKHSPHASSYAQHPPDWQQLCLRQRLTPRDSEP